MIDLQLDMRAFEQRAREIAGAVDQLPFVISRSLNEAAEKTRDHLANQTWPSSVQARDKNFMKAALSTKGARATKEVFRVTIFDKLDRGHLALHDQGGTKAAKGRLAIPLPVVKGKRGSKGVPKGLRPTALPNSFRKGDVIYQRVGNYTRKGKQKMSAFAGRDQRKLVPVYVLKPSARIKHDVPFTVDFRHVMSREINAAFPSWMAKAMATRRG
jgi:hypothetical protein